MSERLHVAAFAELDPATLYALLRLRVDVFVVEQACAYPELDGRDTEPGTRHLWLTQDDDGAPAAYLRVLSEPDGSARIGRVVVTPAARGGGAAGRLMAAALAEVGDRPSVLDAQAHLVAFYGRHGYAATGPEYLEDGIPHVPMARLSPAGPGRSTAGVAPPTARCRG
ncbi:GNAT family N-acetyltransferase [Pimelobacter simplex]|uniref:GNAT family N-acetyltransferase n=1 Tax=Nocardioides simplex TaxID=2045 RepID=UPI00381A971A